MSSFIKNRPVGAQLFHADGQKDMTKLIVAFRNFAHRLKFNDFAVCHPQTLVFLTSENKCLQCDLLAECGNSYSYCQTGCRNAIF
jgi:hypothetical protein